MRTAILIWKMERFSIPPGSLPMILAGTRLALNSASMLTIASEMMAAQTGLGALIRPAWETLSTERLYPSLLVTTLLGIGFSALVRLSE